MINFIFQRQSACGKYDSHPGIFVISWLKTELLNRNLRFCCPPIIQWKVNQQKGILYLQWIKFYDSRYQKSLRLCLLLSVRPWPVFQLSEANFQLLITLFLYNEMRIIRITTKVYHNRPIKEPTDIEICQLYMHTCGYTHARSKNKWIYICNINLQLFKSR